MQRFSKFMFPAAALVTLALTAGCAVPPSSSGDGSDVSAGTQLTGSRIKYKGGAQPMTTAGKEDTKDALRANGGGNPNK